MGGALRWGEPAYLTPVTRSGSTIRIGPANGTDDHHALYFNGQTTLKGTFREMYPDLFTYSDDRAIVFQLEVPIPTPPLAQCLALALRYHLDKRRA